MGTEKETKNSENHEDKLRQDFLSLIETPQGRSDAADAFISLRKRVRKYQEVREEEAGTLIAEMAAELDLNALQTGRLQMLVHESNERTKEAIRKVDAQSPALHPLDRKD